LDDITALGQRVFTLESQFRRLPDAVSGRKSVTTLTSVFLVAGLASTAWKRVDLSTRVPSNTGKVLVHVRGTASGVNGAVQVQLRLGPGATPFSALNQPAVGVAGVTVAADNSIWIPYSGGVEVLATISGSATYSLTLEGYEVSP